MSTRTWLEDHPLIRHVFIPVGACWLNLQESWWRIFRKAALAGQSFAGHPRSSTPPAWQHRSSTPELGPGYGNDPHHQPASYGDDMCTPFERSSTRWRGPKPSL
nr:hypothetical protein [Streptomyces hygroscopicus]